MSSPLLLVVHALLLLLVLRAWPGSSALHQWRPRESKEEPFCYPFNDTCGPITPSPPIRYEAHLECVDLVYNITHYMEEFYLYEADVLAVVDSRESLYTHTIFFYEINTVVLISAERGEEEGWQPAVCTVAEISHDAWIDPFPGQDNSTHLVLAPSQALLFGDNYRYSWAEYESVRGLNCNRWDACIKSDMGIFYVEYDWSDPEHVFDILGYTNERPIQIRVTGRAQPFQGTTQTVPIDAVYSAALFDDNPRTEDIRWAFEIPSGVYCEGLPAGKQPPTMLSTAFSMRVEVTMQISTDSHQEYVSTVWNWYDFIHKLTRADSITNPATVEYSVAGLVEVAVIRDFRAGVEYVVDKSLGNCTTIALTGGGYDTITTPDGQYTIKDPLLLFGLGENSNLTYHGTKYARGLPCDVWAGHLDFEYDNGTIHNAFLYEIYFLQAGWMEEAGTGREEFPVPVLVSLQQDFSVAHLPEDLIVNLHENIFKYEEETPFMTVYDITPCFSGHDHIRRFEIAFPGSYRGYYENDAEQFTLRVNNGLVIYLEVPVIRVQHVQIEYEETYDCLFCEFTLVDQPQVDMDFPPYVGKPLDQVVELLEASMDTLAFVILDNEGRPLLMRPINDSLREMFEDGCYQRSAHSLPFHDQDYSSPASHIPAPSYPEAAEGGMDEDEDGDSEAEGFAVSAFWAEVLQLARSSDEKIYSPGAMAGMAIGMLVLGVLLGTVVMLAALKKMGLSTDIEFIPMNSRRR